MKRKRILTQYLLYFLMLMLLLAVGCSSSDNDTPEPTTDADAWVTVSGTVTTSTGAPLSGVVMSPMINLEVMGIDLLNIRFGSNTFSLVVTGDDGTYSMTVITPPLENYTLALTPSKKGYIFTPAERALTITSADQAGVNFVATARNEFSQADLSGIWRVNTLRTGTENAWMRARISINATTGEGVCLSMRDSAGNTACPIPFSLRFIMNDGVITQTGDNRVANGGHMTMNSAKNFMAGTGTNGTAYQLTIAQKEGQPLVTPAQILQSYYTPADVRGKTFVFHSLSVGGTNQWRYGNGSTASGSAALPLVPGQIAMEAEADSAGGTATTLDGWILVLAPTGVVTRIDATGLLSDFEGFLSSDERTIVGTYSENGTDYKLIVFQITEDSQIWDEMTGTSTNHLLGAATTPTTPIWAYHDINISRFEATALRDIFGLTLGMNIMLAYDWYLSLPDYTAMQKLALMKIRNINIATNGAATILDTSTTPETTLFHGQLAFDGTYMVGVETLTLDEGIFYTLNVITHEANN